MKNIVILLLAISLGIGCGTGETRSNQWLNDAEGADALGEADALTEPSPDAADSEDFEDIRGEDASSADADDSDTNTEAPDTTEQPDTHGEPDVSTEPDVTPEPDIIEAPGPFELWMSPSGSDSRDGSSPSAAVKTLNRVHEILVANDPDTDVEIWIAPGRYRGQKVSWTFSVPGHSVTLSRLAGETERPVFDGCLSSSNCPGGTWFMLRRSDGAETNIKFNYLRIENYQTAISLNGSRNAESSSNGSNSIYGCYFYRIGNVFNASVEPSTAAVRLVNSDDNEIINNHFVDIINTRSPGRLHAIYAAHMSDRNRIERNRFVNNAGDPVRFRDYSNDNIINENTFKKSAIGAAYSEWYCDHDARNDCTKATPECPSWGNQFRDNHLNGTYACGVLPTFVYYQDDSTTGCSPPSASARRLRTSGNTHAATACE